MEFEPEPLVITPGQSLGFMSLGSSLQSILTIIKAQSKTYTAIEVQYSQSSPLSIPVVVNLPKNGIRLRFDGPEQRLRCIELVNFAKTDVAYKGSELNKHRENGTVAQGPSFKRIYQLFGATFPGEYVAPQKSEYTGTYMLSWPGIAFSFPMQHSAWSPAKDHVSLLGSQAAGPTSHMVIFEGKTWPQACSKLFEYESNLPRYANIVSRTKEPFPPEIESISIIPDEQLLLHRKTPSADFAIILHQTTPQDLISELGPPDATYRRDATNTAPENRSHKRSDSVSKPVNSRRAQSGSTPSSYSSTATDTYETDFDSDVKDDDPLERASRENFWCYFSHGMDILVVPARSPNHRTVQPVNTASSNLVVGKVVLHGNVPGTYAFNRHRRIRWRLSLAARTVDSEANFDSAAKPALLRQFAGVLPESEMARGKVVNRSWGASSDDSAFFLPDAGTELVEGSGSEQWMGNTKLYHFPGLVFEVTENGAVTAVTVH